MIWSTQRLHMSSSLTLRFSSSCFGSNLTSQAVRFWCFWAFFFWLVIVELSKCYCNVLLLGHSSCHSDPDFGKLWAVRLWVLLAILQDSPAGHLSKDCQRTTFILHLFGWYAVPGSIRISRSTDSMETSNKLTTDSPQYPSLSWESWDFVTTQNRQTVICVGRSWLQPKQWGNRQPCEGDDAKTVSRGTQYDSDNEGLPAPIDQPYKRYQTHIAWRPVAPYSWANDQWGGLGMARINIKASDRETASAYWQWGPNYLRLAASYLKVDSPKSTSPL